MDDVLLSIEGIAKRQGFIIDKIQSDLNHLHILVDLPPRLSAFEIAHQLKQISTFDLYRKHRSFLKKHFWRENTFWSDGYFVCSTGEASTETIRNYIENQG